jgi:hypothetical protein
MSRPTTHAGKGDFVSRLNTFSSNWDMSRSTGYILMIESSINPSGQKTRIQGFQIIAPASFDLDIALVDPWRTSRVGIGANLRLNTAVRSGGKLNIVIGFLRLLHRDPISRPPGVALEPHLVAKLLQSF